MTPTARTQYVASLHARLLELGFVSIARQAGQWLLYHRSGRVVVAVPRRKAGAR